jgi:hypothetical protein
MTDSLTASAAVWKGCPQPIECALNLGPSDQLQRLLIYWEDM